MAENRIKELTQKVNNSELRFFCITDSLESLCGWYPVYAASKQNNIKKCLKKEYKVGGYFRKRRIVKSIVEIPLDTAKKATFFDNHVHHFLREPAHKDQYMLRKLR